MNEQGARAAQGDRATRSEWDDWADATACRLHAAQRWRAPRPFEGDGVTGEYEGRREHRVVRLQRLPRPHARIRR